MTHQALIREAKSLAQTLKSLTQSLTVTDEMIDGSKKDMVYEIYVSLTMLTELTGTHKLSLQGSKAKTGVLRFPRKPGKKANFPYIFASPTGQNTGLSFQICFGVEYENSFGTTFAPDISFQTDISPDHPTCSHVHFIWDCKNVKVDGTTVLSRDAVIQVAGYLLNVCKPNAGPLPLRLNQLPSKNSVISNGRMSSLKDADLTNLKICEVSSYFTPANSKKNAPNPVIRG